MNVHIHKSIQQQHPNFRLALVPAKGLIEVSKMPSFEGDLRKVQEEIRKTWTMEKIDTDPHFQLWREAYKAFGAKQKKRMCSVENMYRSIISGREIPSIHLLVDAYTIVSLQYKLPVGADDLDSIGKSINWDWQHTYISVTDQTRNAIIYIENLLPNNRAVIDSAAAKMQLYIQQLTD